MISIKLAKEISLLKWDGELNGINNNDKIKKLYPNANNYYYCGFCIRHNYSNYPDDINKCLNCEIAKSEAKNCLHDNSLYNSIKDSYQDLKVKSIKKLIVIIKNIPEANE